MFFRDFIQVSDNHLQTIVARMIDKKTLKKIIGAALEGKGLTRKGQSWYYAGEDVLLVVNLQKSDWSDRYYINLGFWLNAFGLANFPQYNHCHLYFRAEAFFPDQRALLQSSCSLDQSSPELLEALSGFLASQLLPFLLACTDDAHLRALLAQGKLDVGFVRQHAREYLSS